MPLHPSLIQRQFFQPSCPSGGTFYACTSGTNFVGCCTSNSACSSGCPDGSLQPASFNPSYYGQFQDQECPTGSQWYTCTATTPPFMGCCKSNPCAGHGCPVGDVTAAFLSSNPKVAADFAGAMGYSASLSGSPTSTAAASSATASPTASTTSSPLASATANPVSTLPIPAPSTPIGAIVGAAIGGAALLILLIAVILFFRRRRQSHEAIPNRFNMDSKPAAPTDAVPPTPMYEAHPKKDHEFYTPPTPAPQYAYNHPDHVSSSSPSSLHPQTSPPPLPLKDEHKRPLLSSYHSSSSLTSPAPRYSPPKGEYEMDAAQVPFQGPYEMGGGGRRGSVGLGLRGGVVEKGG